MFKAVLKKNRDGGKGNKKDSGMWNIKEVKTANLDQENKFSRTPRLRHKLYFSGRCANTSLCDRLVSFGSSQVCKFHSWLYKLAVAIFHRHSSC